MKMCLVTKILVLLASVAFSMASEIAKPECQDECGGVQIPFPFGIGSDCSFINTYLQYPYSEAFKINCDYTTDPPVPFLLSDGIQWEVLSINVEDHTIRVSSGAEFECSLNESITSTNTTWNLLASSFGLSFNIVAARNKFLTIGCNTVTRLSGYSKEDVSECTTSCRDSGVGKDGVYNSAFGRCEASIFSNFSSASIEIAGNATSPSVYPCRYAFVAEVGSYNLSAANLSATSDDCLSIRVPVIYSWYLTYDNMTCSTNAYNEVIDGFVNHCKCLEGYTGNAYLLQGCQDIDECLDERLNDCQKQEFCVNKIGGYDCICPHGHLGNGTVTNPCIVVHGAAKLIHGVSIGVSSMIGSIILYCMYNLIKRRRKIKERKDNFKRNGGLLLQLKMSAGEVAMDRTKVFSQSELEKTTDNFNNNRVLGRGGQGTVYKGMLGDGTIVAVKKSNKVDENQLAQFINEVVILSEISHRNIVKIFGCCLETEVPLLVYEFVPNGTLYQHIHHPTEDFHMTWKVRFQIALECAEAIAYLHSSCYSPIYHRDIKSSNILLDEKYKAKISDFGTSRTISIDKTHVTTCVQGTFGYLDPEFFRSSQFSEKSDVYSFGVVLLELLTSKKPIFTNSSREPRGLATEFLQLMETSPHQLHGFLDAQVLQQCSEEEIEALTKLIEQCLSLYGKQRPTMREVARTLEMIYSQHEGNNVANDQEGIHRQEGRVILTDDMSVTSEGPYSTSAFTNTSCSMNLELLFDSNFEA